MVQLVRCLCEARQSHVGIESCSMSVKAFLSVACLVIFVVMLRCSQGSWNMQLMELLFQFWESGTNPYEAVQGLDTEETDAAGLRALSFSVPGRDIVGIRKPENPRP